MVHRIRFPWLVTAWALVPAVAAAQTLPGKSHPGAPPPAEVVPRIDLPADAASVPIRSDQQARPTLDVRIAGQGPFRFLVDTGAQSTVVGRDLASQLALPRAGRAMLVATGSRQVVDLVQVRGLAFADRQMNLSAIPVLESAHLGAEGILGLDSLQGLRVLIDFRARRIALSDPREAAGTGGYEIVVRARKRLGQMIIADAQVDGVRTAVVTDTGAALSIGNPALLRRLRAKRQDDAQTTDVNGVTFAADMRLAQRVTIGSMSIDQVPIGFANSPAFHALDVGGRPALILGMSALAALDRMAIDFATRRVMFDLPRASRRTESRRQAPRAY